MLRTVFPGSDRSEVLPLYVAAGTNPWASAEVLGRHALRIPAGGRASLLSYFNAFPAGYWERSTVASAVRLEIRTAGPGRVRICRSDGAGIRDEVCDAEVHGESVERFDLQLTGFTDGGWYWFELEAGGTDLQLVSAEWSVAADVASPETVSIVVTTHNRPDFCVRLLEALGSDDRVAATIDRIFVVDQGTRNVRDELGFEAVSAVHGERLVVIEQDNLGGSGGFSRGMSELLRRDESGYLLLLDDDITLEPEGVLRALEFARFAVRPTIVGGHMLDLNAPLVLHAFGEVIDQRTFDWGPADPAHRRHDFGEAALGDTPWLHRTADVDFNGWWMCLVPREVIEKTGLSLPFFIKWDDAEYGLRAGAHGFDTVSLPGAAVWHISWLDKDDSRDWQSYFHSRNRLISALLHSPRRFGGTLLGESFGLDLKHLLFLQYYAVRLRHEALRDLLRGPRMLEETLRSRLPWARAIAAEFEEMTPRPVGPHAGVETVHDDRATTPRPRGPGMAAWLARNLIRHFLPVRQGHEEPVHLSRDAARWWRVPTYDAVLVPLADGTGSALYRRDPARFRAGLRDSVVLHLQVLASWRRLRHDYRDAADGLASPAAWERYFRPEPAGAVPADGAVKPAADSSREIRSS